MWINFPSIFGVVGIVGILNARLTDTAILELNAIKIAEIIHQNCSDVPASPTTSA
jgi:hypothetical protein